MAEVTVTFDSVLIVRLREAEEMHARARESINQKMKYRSSDYPTSHEYRDDVQQRNQTGLEVQLARQDILNIAVKGAKQQV